MQFLLCCSAVSIVVELPHLHLFINFSFMQIEQDEAAATDSRARDGTEANVSDHETNDVGLERPDVDVSQSSVFAIFTLLFSCQCCS